MARKRTADYDIQRDKILEQAANLFARGGYPGTSMNDVAEACGVSKPALYHYVRDKYQLLVHICERHIERLEAVVHDVAALGLAPEPRLRALIARFVDEYSVAQSAHRVLTEDVKFLESEDRDRILDAERRVVAYLAQTVAALRPEVDTARLSKPLTMLLFGMINWMFTWLKPGGELDHAAMAPIVADLFLGGLDAVKVERPLASTMELTGDT
ncbi:TetR/AcrR family transcriptional regulator [Pararobbsia silviterrae]|uniref:TetR/AcrR family transcriptional regulator n=1 Tax=Pararobbsia silviterrae TaxID=1792498 RepID=A0A494XZ86_9BURK|nr:TetR/AcrR family transcriptional regulator [Pararobbsia silviterrae]RKP55874.1 TetR/AcrR family transcriptional regulator [Pararobbsia silviterrae]